MKDDDFELLGKVTDGLKVSSPDSDTLKNIIGVDEKTEIHTFIGTVTQRVPVYVMKFPKSVVKSVNAEGILKNTNAQNLEVRYDREGYVRLVVLYYEPIPTALWGD